MRARTLGLLVHLGCCAASLLRGPGHDLDLAEVAKATGEVSQLEESQRACEDLLDRADQGFGEARSVLAEVRAAVGDSFRAHRKLASSYEHKLGETIQLITKAE